jgi:hypothetical protein
MSPRDLIFLKHCIEQRRATLSRAIGSMDLVRECDLALGELEEVIYQMNSRLGSRGGKRQPHEDILKCAS